MVLSIDRNLFLFPLCRVESIDAEDENKDDWQKLNQSENLFAKKSTNVTPRNSVKANSSSIIRRTIWRKKRCYRGWICEFIIACWM